MLNDTLFRLKAIFRRRTTEVDLADEIRLHIEHQIERYQQAGLTFAEAARRAHIELGGVEQLKEDCRDSWGIRLWETTVQDLRYARRQLLRRPAFTLAVVATLALGIGATTALFTVTNSLLLRSLPVPNPQELVVIARDLARPFPLYSYADYLLISAGSSDAFTGVAASNEGNAVGFSTMDTGRHDVPEVVSLAFISLNYFEVLGTGSSMGRVLTTGDGAAAGSNPSVVVSYDFWQRRLGGSLTILGQPVRLNNAVFTVAGVASKGFTGTHPTGAPDVYAPLTAFPAILPLMRNNWNAPGRQWLVLAARLRPGVSGAQATARIDSLFAGRVSKPGSSGNRDGRTATWRTVLVPGVRGLPSQFSKPMFILLSASGLLLLLACANVAGLLLARALQREREIAVRLALGASRSRLIRQMLTESVLLSLIGGVFGLLVGITGAHVIVQLLPADGPLPLLLDVSPDGRVLGFAFAVSILTGLLFGLGPALRSSRRDLVPGLKAAQAAMTGARWLRIDLRRGLVVTQVALSVVLLASVGLLVRSLQSLDALDLGYSRDGLLFVYVQPSQFGYQGARAREFYERLRQRTASLPGVTSTSLADFAPLDDGNDSGTVSRPAQDLAVPVESNAVSEGYLKTLGISLLAGRDFTSQDAAPGAQPVAMISESLAQLVFPGENPIGKRLSYGERFDARESWQISGVVRDARYFGVRDKPAPMVYMPVDPAMSRMVLCIRTAGIPELLIPAVRREVAALDPAVPVLEARTMTERVNKQNAQERLLTTLFGSFGLIALVLASIGLYGVLAFGVASRTREIGIRTALGAHRFDAVGRVIADVGMLVGTGAVMGVLAGLAGVRLIAGFLYGVKPFDALAFISALGVLATAAAVASYLPALRASRVDPAVALRHE